MQRFFCCYEVTRKITCGWNSSWKSEFSSLLSHSVTFGSAVTGKKSPPKMCLLQCTNTVSPEPTSVQVILCIQPPPWLCLEKPASSRPCIWNTFSISSCYNEHFQEFFWRWTSVFPRSPTFLGHRKNELSNKACRTQIYILTDSLITFIAGESI